MYDVHAFIVEVADVCPKCKAGVNLTLDVFVASEVTTLEVTWYHMHLDESKDFA